MLPGRQHQASPLFQPHEPCLWQPLDIFGQLILEPQPRSVLVSLTRHGPCCALLFWLQPRSVRRKSSLALAPLIRGWVNFRGLTGEMWGGLGPAKLIQIKQVLSDSLHVSRDTLYKVEHNMGAKTWTLRSEVLKAKTRWVRSDVRRQPSVRPNPVATSIKFLGLCSQSLQNRQRVSRARALVTYLQLRDKRRCL